MDVYGYGTVYSRDHDPGETEIAGLPLSKAECSTASLSMLVKAWDPARAKQSIAAPAIVQVSGLLDPLRKTVNLRDEPAPGAVFSLTRKALAVPAGIMTSTSSSVSSSRHFPDPYMT